MPLLDTYLKENKTKPLLQKNMHPDAHSSNICNSQDMDTTQVSIRDD